MDALTSVSIILATRNRAERLGRTLQSFQALERTGRPGPLRVEVIVVDNGSTDATRATVEAWQGRSAFPIRYLHETARGKSSALNAGARQATGGLFLFTDDDCYPQPGWLLNYLEEFASEDAPDLVGGQVRLFDSLDAPVGITTPPPHWPPCARRQLLDTSDIWGPIIGANMAMRRTVFEQIGGFDPLLGPGSPLEAVAEDLDLVYRVLRAGFRAVYSPIPLVLHHHGRKPGTGDDGVLRTYQIGRAAFCFKHWRDPQLRRQLYWDLRYAARRRSGRRLWRLWSGVQRYAACMLGLRSYEDQIVRFPAAATPPQPDRLRCQPLPH